ncbi:MAG: helix-turn-helix domain-containing protein [Bilifractor sp.]
MISYNKLWKLLIDKNMMRTEMAKRAGITGNVLGRLSKNQPVSLGSLEKICDLLDCDIGDIMEFKADNDRKEHNVESTTLSSISG